MPELGMRRGIPLRAYIAYTHAHCRKERFYMKKLTASLAAATMTLCMTMPAMAAEKYGIDWSSSDFTISGDEVSLTNDTYKEVQLKTSLGEVDKVNINVDLKLKSGASNKTAYFKIRDDEVDNILCIRRTNGGDYFAYVGTSTVPVEIINEADDKFHNFDVTLDFVNDKATIVADNNTSASITVDIRENDMFNTGRFTVQRGTTHGFMILKNLSITPITEPEVNPTVAEPYTPKEYVGEDKGYTVTLNGEGNAVKWYAKPSEDAEWKEIATAKKEEQTLMSGGADYVVGLVITDIGDNSLKGYSFGAEMATAE